VTYRHRVLYGDTDQMQIVYYANYLRFFEGARNEWLRTHGMTYVDIERAGIQLPVVDCAIRYLRPAKYDDLLEIEAKVSASRVRIRFDYEVRRQGSPEMLVEGHTVHASIGKEGRPVRMPEWLVEKLGPHVQKGLHSPDPHR
jgi:acyl-CoA thioester hydrolase